jgi:hypothetical protein
MASALYLLVVWFPAMRLSFPIEKRFLEGAVGRELNRLCWLTRAYLIRLGRAVLLKIARFSFRVKLKSAFFLCLPRGFLSFELSIEPDPMSHVPGIQILGLFVPDSTSLLNFIRSRGISRPAGGRIPSEQNFLRAPRC